MEFEKYAPVPSEKATELREKFESKLDIEDDE